MLQESRSSNSLLFGVASAFLEYKASCSKENTGPDLVSCCNLYNVLSPMVQRHMDTKEPAWVIAFVSAARRFMALINEKNGPEFIGELVKANGSEGAVNHIQKLCPSLPMPLQSYQKVLEAIPGLKELQTPDQTIDLDVLDKHMKTFVRIASLDTKILDYLFPDGEVKQKTSDFYNSVATSLQSIFTNISKICERSMKVLEKYRRISHTHGMF